MATELQIAQGFQTLIQAMSRFDDADVVINADDIYDNSISNCPYVVIHTADNFDFTPAAGRTIGTTIISFTLVEEFVTYEETDNMLRDDRQAIIDEVFTGAGMSANGLEGVMVTRVFSLTGLDGITYTDGEILPVFRIQTIGIEVELF